MRNKSFEILHILGALGAAGMTASFFFAINFMTVHEHAFIDFDTLMTNYIGRTDALSLFVQAYILGAIGSAGLHFVLLGRWFKGFAQYKLTQDYQDLLTSNREVQLMAIPLTLSMTMNVFFILGALFIPGLFSEISLFGVQMQLIDPLFIMAGLYFSGMFYMAAKIFGTYFLRLVDGELDFIANANLSQMLAIFSFGMIGVGLAAMGISKVPTIALIGSSLAYIVLALAVMLAVLKFTLGMKSIFTHGMASGATVTLLIPITVLAMLTVGLYRADVGMVHAFGVPKDTTFFLMLFTIGAGLSLVIGVFGIMAMKKKGFFKQLEFKTLDASALALICPGFALEVQMVFWLFAGLVMNGVVEHGSTAFFMLWIPMIALQWVTIYFLFKLLKANGFLKFDFQALQQMPKAA